MDRWIDRVFVDGRYIPGGMLKRDLAKTKAEYEMMARKVLAESGVDSVVYCFIEYDADGEIKMARFYSGLKMSSDELQKAVDSETGDFYVGAVHK